MLLQKRMRLPSSGTGTIITALYKGTILLRCPLQRTSEFVVVSIIPKTRPAKTELRDLRVSQDVARRQAQDSLIGIDKGNDCRDPGWKRLTRVRIIGSPAIRPATQSTPNNTLMDIYSVSH